MPNTVSFDEPHACVVITRTGDVAIEEVRESGARALELADAHGCQRMLIDNTTMTSGPTIVQMIQAVRGYLEHSGIEEFRFALVVPAGSPVSDAMRQLETVARNRRIDMRLFHVRDDAVAWLADGSTFRT
jgi:hypothetical protein